MKSTFERLRRKVKEVLPFGRKVDFAICGTQKGGTSALDAYLREHPEICMADVKEVHFFDTEKHFAREAINYSKYHSFFTPQKSHKILGEATPVYMYWPNAPQRLREYNPRMKLIILLRNPIERAYSHWNMQRTRGIDKLPFWDAIREEKPKVLHTAVDGVQDPFVRGPRLLH